MVRVLYVRKSKKLYFKQAVMSDQLPLYHQQVLEELIKKVKSVINQKLTVDVKKVTGVHIANQIHRLTSYALLKQFVDRKRE